MIKLCCRLLALQIRSDKISEQAQSAQTLWNFGLTLTENFSTCLGSLSAQTDVWSDNCQNGWKSSNVHATV